MIFIEVNEANGPIFLQVDEISFVTTRSGQTEIFLKNRTTPLAVKESLTEIVQRMRSHLVAVLPAATPSPA